MLGKWYRISSLNFIVDHRSVIHSCHQNGSLTLIFMPISRHSQNIMHSLNHAASITVWSSPPAASRARVSLIGNVTVLHDESAGANGIRECYVEKHPDAERWLPENQDAPHQVSVPIFCRSTVASRLNLVQGILGTL